VVDPPFTVQCVKKNSPEYSVQTFHFLFLLSLAFFHQEKASRFSNTDEDRDKSLLGSFPSVD
jgi:hypothetical protein